MGVRKWQFLIKFSTERNHKGEGRVGQKPQNFDYSSVPNRRAGPNKRAGGKILVKNKRA